MNNEMNQEIFESEEIVEMEKKETLLDKGKNLLKAGVSKAKDGVKWAKENPTDAGMVFVEAAAGLGVVLLTAAGLKSTKNADRMAEDLYQQSKAQLENEQPKEIYIVKQ